jgi:SPP1 family predicted phage head-tail adaptor
MRAGSLRETVLVEYPVETINEYGESIQTWEPKLQCRAAITQLSSAQLVRAGKPEDARTFRVILRWNPGVDMPIRLLWVNRNFRKLYVSAVSQNDDVKFRTLELTAEERDE